MIADDLDIPWKNCLEKPLIVRQMIERERFEQYIVYHGTEEARSDRGSPR